MGKIDVEYFSRRMREEQEAAARAIPVASLIHQQLAEKYASVVAACEGELKEEQGAPQA